MELVNNTTADSQETAFIVGRGGLLREREQEQQEEWWAVGKRDRR